MYNIITDEQIYADKATLKNLLNEAVALGFEPEPNAEIEFTREAYIKGAAYNIMEVINCRRVCLGTAFTNEQAERFKREGLGQLLNDWRERHLGIDKVYVPYNIADIGRFINMKRYGQI